MKKSNLPIEFGSEYWYYSMGFYLLVTSSPESNVNVKLAMHAV
jgi:hypothetical protein